MFGAKVIAKGEQIEVLMATDLPGILIVDDNEDNRYTLQLMLESDGHERITCAAGGNQAIALVEKEKFSLVLLDLMMPEMDGFAVVAALQKEAGWRDIPVIVITSLDLDAKDRARLNAGVQFVMVKEKFRPADLVERIRRLVHSKSPVSTEMEAAS